jgi:hypothetical protein
MKILLSIPVLGIALFSMSCRTPLPLDPMTMKLSTRCLPENVVISDTTMVSAIECTK